MNGRAAQALEVRIGALVEHESEHSVLREVERLLVIQQPGNIGRKRRHIIAVKISRTQCASLTRRH